MSEANTTGRLEAFTTYAEPELRDEAGRTVAVLPCRWADARRLAACWNALQHIPTTELELGTMQNMILKRRDAEDERDALAAKVEELIAERDVLAAKLAGPVRLTEADLEECKRLADAGSPVPHMSWSQRLAFAIESAVLERNGLKPQAKGD